VFAAGTEFLNVTSVIFGFKGFISNSKDVTKPHIMSTREMCKYTDRVRQFTYISTLISTNLYLQNKSEWYMELGPHMQVLGRFRSSSYLSQAEDSLISFYAVNSRVCNDPAYLSCCFSHTVAVLLDEHEAEEFSTR
jgi:hypothetical protein